MTDEQLYQLHLDGLGKSKGERIELRRWFARLHKVTEDAVRKRLQRLTPREQPRTARITPELEAAVRAIWPFKLTADGAISTEMAQQIALAEGAIVQPHPLTSLNQAARVLGINPATSYCRRMEAPHANHTHRVDASGSRHFRVRGQDAENDDWILEVCRAEQRNKRWPDGQLLWCLSVIDDYSRLLNQKYVVAPGESAELVQSFLVEVWRTGRPEGLPELLICDQGSFGKHQSSKAMLHWLGIGLELGMPENKRRNGRIERPFRSLKEGFERSYLTTHGVGKRVRLSQLREEHSIFIGRMNERRHPIRRDRTKLEDWQRGMGFRELRPCPDDALFLATYRQERKVTGEGWIWLNKNPVEIINLPPGLQGKAVTLIYNRQGEMVAEHGGALYATRRPEGVVLGTYGNEAERGRKSPPAKAALKAAGEQPKSGVALFSKKGQAALKAAGQKPVAPGQPVLAGEDAPKLITPPAPRRAPLSHRDPFRLATVWPDLRAAEKRLGELVGRPLHACLDEEHLAKVRQVLETFGLDRKKTEELGHKLKKAIGF